MASLKDTVTLTPKFTDADLAATYKVLAKEAVKKQLQVFQYMGETFINAARRSGTYTDRTGNLRSSIGYVILIDGAIWAQAFDSATNSYNQQLTAELSIQLNKGIVLICMAGMGYAAAVESKGYDVITGSTPSDAAVKQLLKKVCSQY